MSKVTSKRQVTIPKRIADEYGISEGDDIMWIAEGGAIKVLPHQQPAPPIDPKERLELFDQATERQQRREVGRIVATPPGDRGWTREELHDRDGTR
ncbi:MAG: AbrB/MazE/SpoVT family DNA-binding domain-containing protein [Thermoanaerobaculia bacterium]